MNEDELIKGKGMEVSAQKVVEMPCACGGVVRVNERVQTISATVQAHQRTERHARWRDWQEAGYE